MLPFFSDPNWFLVASHMAELYDIRRMLDPRDIDFVKRNSRSLLPNQVLDISTAKYGAGFSSSSGSGGGCSGIPMGKALKFGAAALAACAVVLAGITILARRKPK